MKAALRFLAVGGVAALVACGGRSLSQKDSDDDDAGGGGTGGSRGGRGGRGGSGGTTGPLGGTSSGGAPGGTTAFGGTAGTPGGTAGAPGGTTATGGTPAFGGTAGNGIGGLPNGFVVEPDETGCIERTDDFTEEPVQGCFYVFADQYPDPTEAKCLLPGLHTPAECSIIHSPPPPPSIGFPQDIPGVMCTIGSVAQVLACAPNVTGSGCPGADYANMWGAGLGFDFNADKREDGGAKRPWNPAMPPGPYIGLSFDITEVPIGGLRVEIPMLLTDEEAARSTPPLAPGSSTSSHPEGSPYWGATQMYPNSPVIPGRNRVLWRDIRPPHPESYTFDPARMLSVHFHVPANPSSRTPYGFCISNLTLLRE